MRFDVKSVGFELLLLTIFFADDHSHFHFLHVVEHGIGLFLFLGALGFIALLYQRFFLFGPVLLHFVIHSHSGVFIYTHHHSFAQESPSWEMVGYVFGYAVKSLFAFDDLQYA